jgi:hypothetical protein
MQVESLRDIINEILSYAEEETRVGIFWCYAADYDACYPIFKDIFTNKKIWTSISGECIIKRCNEGFLVKDPYGGRDVFTNDEVALFLDLWEKAQKAKPQVIYMDYDEIIKEEENVK